MSMLDPKAQATLDTFVYKQLLHSAGLDKGMSGMAGMVFTDVLADAIAKSAAPLVRSDPGPGVTSGFGERLDPITRKPSQHPGVDVQAAQGAPITAAWDGTVVSAGERGGYGNAVEVDHGHGVHTLYAHASSLSVQAGDVVKAGGLLGEVGSSGRSTGPHLHLELRVDGHPVDPASALKAYRDRVEGTSRGGSHEGS
jgi:murein DD-endopeptidase MepM/ murein hydrolase activator NlpD